MDASQKLIKTISHLPLGGWRSALRAFCTSGALIDSLRAVLRDRRRIERVAQASFFHATGGYKIVLASQGYEAAELRLHIWPTGHDIHREHNLYTAHNHKWDFASYILAGTFLKTMFAEVAGQPMHDLFHYDSPLRGQTYVTHRIGPRALRELMAIELTTGDAYTQTADALHTFTPLDTAPSVTLFARTRYLPVSHTSVYVPAGHQPIVDFPAGPPPLAADEVVDLAQLVLRLSG